MPQVTETILSPLQRDILNIIGESDLPLSQQHLAEATSMSKATISTNVNELVSANLVYKVDGVPGASRRVVGYRITPDGISALENGHFFQASNEISPETLESIVESLKIAVDRLNDIAAQYSFFVETAFTLKATADNLVEERHEILEILRSLRATPPEKPEIKTDKSKGWKFSDYDSIDAAVDSISAKLNSEKQFNSWKNRPENLAGAPDFFPELVEKKWRGNKEAAAHPNRDKGIAIVRKFQAMGMPDNAVTLWLEAVQAGTTDKGELLIDHPWATNLLCDLKELGLEPVSESYDLPNVKAVWESL